MTIWKDSTNQLHDDMNGEALTLESWPQGMTQLTDAEVAAIQAAALAAIPPQPDTSGFINACKTAVGGITAIAYNPSLGMWSLTFNAAVQAGDWADVQTLVEHAQTSGTITAQQYVDIKAAVISNHITGVVLS